jgi:hypothetical protein
MSKNIEKEVDFAEYEIDEPEESKAAKDAVKAAAGKVAVQAAAGAGVDPEEESDLVKQLRAELAAAKSAKKRAPKGLYKTQCEDEIKKIKPTIKYIKDKHDVHLECYMLGLFLKDITDDLPESDDHDAYKRCLTDNKEFFGLKKQPRKSGAGSTNVSMALGDLTLDQDTIDDNEDEDAGAGAGTGAGSP